MRTLFLLAVTVACCNSVAVAQSNQTAPSNQNSQAPKVDSQNVTGDSPLSGKQVEKLSSIRRKSQLIDEAEKKRYAVRRIEFMGNDTIRHRVLAQRVLFKEGDFFTRRLLERSLRNLSRLKIIEPVRLKDVEVYLDSAEELVDLNIRIREKRRQSLPGCRL